MGDRRAWDARDVSLRGAAAVPMLYQGGDGCFASAARGVACFARARRPGPARRRRRRRRRLGRVHRRKRMLCAGATARASCMLAGIVLYGVRRQTRWRQGRGCSSEEAEFPAGRTSGCQSCKRNPMDQQKGVNSAKRSCHHARILSPIPSWMDARGPELAPRNAHDRIVSQLSASRLWPGEWCG